LYKTKSKPFILFNLGPICNADIILAIKYSLMINYGKFFRFSTNGIHLIAYYRFLQCIL